MLSLVVASILIFQQCIMIMKTVFLLSKLYVKSKQSIVLNDKHVSKPLNHSLYRSNSQLFYSFGSSMTITLRQHLICSEWIKVHHTCKFTG